MFNHDKTYFLDHLYITFNQMIQNIQPGKHYIMYSSHNTIVV